MDTLTNWHLCEFDAKLRIKVLMDEAREGRMLRMADGRNSGSGLTRHLVGSLARGLIALGRNLLTYSGEDCTLYGEHRECKGTSL